MKKKKKGGLAMTNVLVEELMRAENYSINIKNKKLEQIKLLFTIKYRENNKYNELIDKYIVCDKRIRDGEATIKGTRITVEDIVYITMEEESKKNVYKQYPSIKNEEQILAALLYVVKYKIGTIKFLIAILLG